MRALQKLCGALAGLLVLGAGGPSAEIVPRGRAVVHHHWVAGDLLTLRSEPWFAGAVSSIRYRGVEFVESSDHGRLLQGAIAFDGLLECLNPTQAGASSDGRRRTTSRRLWAQVSPQGYASATRMAYWLRPGQTCATAQGGTARAANRTRLSDVVYAQRLTFGHGGLPNAVLDEITFTTERAHASAVVEALTLYAPPSFSRFWLVGSEGALTEDLSVAERPGEQARPVILATPDGRSAFAIVSLSEGATYGRWRHPATSKINLVFRPQGPYATGVHAYPCVWLIGTLDEVVAGVRRLQRDG